MMRHFCATGRFAAPLLAVLLAACFASAQEPEARTVPYDGPEFFAHVLHNEGLTAVKTLEEAGRDADKTVLIVFGDPFLLLTGQAQMSRLARYYDAGCNILIATDYPIAIPSLAADIQSIKITQPDESLAFSGNKSCPLLPIQAYSPTGEEMPNDHPIFHFLSQPIATNCPNSVMLMIPNGPLTPLLSFPNSVRGGRPPGVAIMPGMKFLGPPRPRHYIVGSPKDAPADSRAIVIAGHGMFTNGMMLQPDISNFDFATNVVRWLSEGPDGKKRTRALFMVDRTIITDFDMKLTPRPPSLPVPTVRMLNRLIRGLEDERFFYRVFTGLLGNSFGRFIAAVIGIASLLVLVYGLKKLTEARHHLDTVAPSLVGIVPAANPTAPIVERSQAKLRKGDCAEEARQLAVEWLRVELDVGPTSLSSDVRSVFEVKGFFWQRWRLLRQADYVLKVARAGEAVHVSRREFLALVESLRILSAALKDGRLLVLPLAV